jgi:hypothetical protein
MAECPHGKPRRRLNIRQSGPVREHQLGSPLVGCADFDGEPAVIGESGEYPRGEEAADALVGRGRSQARIGESGRTE